MYDDNQNFFFFQSIGLSPVSLIIHSYEQIQLLSRLARSGELRLHIDATGGIIKKAEYVKKQVYLFSAIPDSPFETIPCLSVSDCLLEESRVENVEHWLRKLRNDVSRTQRVHFSHDFTAPNIVIVDFSWVLLHSTASVFCNTTIIGYLNRVFSACVKNHYVEEYMSAIFVCSSHFISRAAKTLSKHFSAKEKDMREFLLHCIAALVCAPSFNSASITWREMVNVFGAAFESCEWTKSYANLTETLKKVPETLNQQQNDDDVDEEGADGESRMHTEICSGVATIRSMSPFTQLFVNPENIIDNMNEDEAQQRNLLHKPEALTHIYRTWLPLYGLWGQAALIGRNTDRYLTNAKVESWFR